MSRPTGAGQAIWPSSPMARMFSRRRRISPDPWVPSMRMTLRSRVPVVLALAAVTVVACVISTTTRPVSYDRLTSARQVITPVKVHLNDGGLVVYPNGALIRTDDVVGTGQRYDVSRVPLGPDTTITIPRDSVLAYETYERTVNPGRTIVYGALSGAASLAGIAVLSVAIFGSCPTIYADSAGVEVLQAESFSNSIAPLLARRDLDRLVALPDSAGRIRLDVRNEALETHYIDHLELVEYRHDAGETAMLGFPDGVLGVRDLRAPTSVRDASAREVRHLVAAEDSLVYSTDDRLLAGAVAGGPATDHLEMSVPRPEAGDTLVLAIRARTSLLATTVLYDHMLGRPGASALDWMGRDLARISTLAELSRWYVDNFAMQVAVRDGEEWKQVAVMVNFGPTAWRSVAVVIPPTTADSVRVRVSFLADAYRIDRVAIGRRPRPLAGRTIPIARVTDAAGQQRDDISATLRRPDGANLQTHPGTRFHAEFEVGRAAGNSRTFMLGAEGYYTEWVRERWMRAASDSLPFSPERTSIRDILQTWRMSKDSLERNFFVRRVPVL